MRDHLLLYLNGRPLRVTGDEVFLTLSDFLRQRQRLTGTKIVCSEGDCGACAVLIGRPSPDGKQLQYASATSCILFMFQLDLTHVVTVEGLGGPSNLNPIQEAMVECHGAQCGFCTPGIVISLCDPQNAKLGLDTHGVRRSLVGNLCRCTGYDSILRAALSADRSKMKSLEELYPSAEILAAFSTAAKVDARVESGAKRFYRPVSVEQATRFRAENPACLIVSGATDLGVERNKGKRDIAIVMSTAGLQSLRTISDSDGMLRVGAGATLAELERATAQCLPELSEFLAYFGSPLIKNSATLAGNLVNASPIGDTIPALFVLEAEIELASLGAVRWVRVEDFYAGYRKTVLRSDEMVTSVRIPLPGESDTFKLYKVSKRKDLDISSFSAAVCMRGAGAVIEGIRIAFGGVAPTVVRLPRTEAFLAGKLATREIFEEAGTIAASEVSPISDVRGSQEYRRILARNILIKFWHDLGQEPAEDAPPPGIGELSLMRSPEGGAA